MRQSFLSHSILGLFYLNGKLSLQKNLRGVVKGTGYMCSCQDCNLSKVNISCAVISNFGGIKWALLLTLFPNL